MKLERWSLHFYRLPYAREVVWANAREDSGLFALLRIDFENVRVEEFYLLVAQLHFFFPLI